MTFQYPSPGPGDVASYLTSGLPWVSSSTVTSGSVWRIDFPYVTSELWIHNATEGSTTTVGVGFTYSGSLGNNRILLSSNQTAGSSYTGDVFEARTRVKTIYIVGLSGSALISVYAGLTVIKTTQFPTLTGSSNPYLSASIPDPVFGYD